MLYKEMIQKKLEECEIKLLIYKILLEKQYASDNDIYDGE